MTTLVMKFYFACLVFFNPLISFTQQIIDVNKQDVKGVNSNVFFVVNGEPFVNAKFTRLVDGSPYFSDEWMKGVAMMDSIGRFAGTVKLDLIENKVHYLDANGNEMVATTRLRQLVLIDTIKQTSFNFIHSSAIKTADIKNGWYQVLMESPTADLMKQYIKTVQEIKPYNSATVEQYIRTSEVYYVFHDQKFTPVKKIKEMADIFADKKQEVLKYISDNKLNGKSDKDFINVMSFYKSLQQ